MLKSIFEVEQVESKVINGVDNPNVLSVDSTAPVETRVDEVNESDDELVHPELKREREDKKKIEEDKKLLEKKDDDEDELTEEEEVEKLKKEREAEKKVPESVQKRIDKAVKSQRVAERERDFFKDKTQKLEAEIFKLKSQTPSVDKPKREDFESDLEYVEALTDWKVDNKFKLKQEETDSGKETSKELQAETDLQEAVVELVDRGREKYEDWDTTAGNKDLKITPELLGIVLESEVPEDIMYFLGNNPDLAADISALPAKKAAIEIGKIEVRLVEEPINTSEDLEESADKDEEVKEEKKEKVKPEPEIKPTKKKVSSAPAPIKPVKTTGLSERDPANMSPKDYRVWRESQKK